MKGSQISCIGIILFFIGLILLLLSWHFSYPIHIVKVNILTFTQFSFLIWPGIIFSLIGLFLTAFYSTRKSIKAICISLFPIILYIYVFYFSYIPSSDSGGIKAMTEIFHQIGIDSSIVSYFQYPTFFSVNEITSQVAGLDINTTAIVFFTLYGMLLSLFVFLFLNNEAYNNHYQIAVLGIPLYFTVLFNYLNYQWVPQTLALVFLFVLLITFNRDGIKYKIFNLIIFIALVFTHAFIPVIFLLFFGLYTIKKKEYFNIFIIMMCIYISVLIYYTTNFFPVIVNAFRETIYGFGGEYSSTIAASFKQPTDYLDQIISLVNRIRIPLTLLIISVGFIIGFIKKRISIITIILAITGGSYLIIGLFYSILGLRALQILVISLIFGIGFFYSKWKKQTVAFVLVLLLLSVFAPMRNCYDHVQVLSSDEENACNFLATKIDLEKSDKIAIAGVAYGYFANKYDYINKDKNNYVREIAKSPQFQAFYTVFNSSIKDNYYIVNNPNLLKEIATYQMDIKDVSILNENLLLSNNKIYAFGETYIIAGVTKEQETNTIIPDIR